MVEKKSNLSLITMMVGAIANLILNALLIRPFGVNGAAFATFLSYLLVFVIRAINTRRFIRINFAPQKLVLNTVLLLAMCALMIAEIAYWPLVCGVLLAVVLWVNMSSLYKGVRQLLRRRRGTV